jgi:hypothetical protein
LNPKQNEIFLQKKEEKNIQQKVVTVSETKNEISLKKIKTLLRKHNRPS